MVYESERSGNLWTEHQLRVYARQRVQSAQKRRRSRVQRRVRWISLALFGVTLAATVARSAAPKEAYVLGRKEVTHKIPIQVITIDRGDSLWGLAQQFRRPGMDLRDSVALISELNGGLSGRLEPGQRLVVPQ